MKNTSEWSDFMQKQGSRHKADVKDPYDVGRGKLSCFQALTHAFSIRLEYHFFLEILLIL